MDGSERQVIDGLFDKLRQVDQQAPQRDADAEAHIRQQIAALPSAPYYMAQALLVQEQALGSLQARVQQLEREATDRQARRRLPGRLVRRPGGASGSPPAGDAGRRGPNPAALPQQGNVRRRRPMGARRHGGRLPGRRHADRHGRGWRRAACRRLVQRFSSGTAEAEELAHQTGWDEPAHTDAEPPEPMDAGYDEQDLDTGGDEGFDV